MHSFFHYYGSKNQGAPRYGPPRRDEVIEPFAGSAAYSVYWEHPNVALYDLSEDVCAAWDWLIHCSDEDVRRIPIPFESDAQFAALPDGPRQVVGWTFWYGHAASQDRLPAWYWVYLREGRLTGSARSYMDRFDALIPNMWDERKRDRIIRQKPLIRNWTIEQLDYRKIPQREAHWHVDPPYQGAPGRAYPHNAIDFPALAEWCRNLPGAVDVCEQEGADWLPFRPLYSMRTSAPGTGTKSSEVVWQKNPDMEDMFA